MSKGLASLPHRNPPPARPKASRLCGGSHEFPEYTRAIQNQNGKTRENVGRRERIRTSGPYVPNVVLYQAELLSEPVQKGIPLASGGALITMPPRPRNRGQGRPQDLGPAAFWAVCGAARLALYGSAPVHPVTTQLGRRQVVRHWILIPAFEGSIPSAPANQSGLGRVVSAYPNSSDIPAS